MLQEPTRTGARDDEQAVWRIDELVHLAEEDPVSMPDRLLFRTTSPRHGFGEAALGFGNISADHQLLIRTAVSQKFSFETVSEELIAQQARCHEKEKARNHPQRRPFYGSYGKKASGKHYNNKP